MTLKEQMDSLIIRDELFYFSITTSTPMLFNNYPRYPTILMPYSKLLKKIMLKYGNHEVLSIEDGFDDDYNFKYKQIMIAI